MSELAITRRLASADRSTVAPAAAVAFAVAMVMFGLTTVALRLATPWDGSEWSARDPNADPARDGMAIVPVAAHSQIRHGERVWAVNGVPLADLRRGPFDFDGPEVESPVQFEVLADGQRRTFSQPLEPFPAALLLQEEWASFLSAAAWITLAIYVLSRRPHDPAAQIMLVLGSAYLPGLVWRWLGPTDLYEGPILPMLAMAQAPYFIGLVSVVGLALVFPRVAPWASRHRRALWLAAALPIAACVVVLALAQLSGEPTLAWGAKVGVIEVLLYISLALFLTVAVPLRYRALEDQADRRRLALVVGSIGVVLVSSVLFWFLPQSLWGSPLIPWGAAGLVGLPVPVALTIAILRYGAFDLQLLINRSLVYGGATAAIALIYVILVGGAILAVHERFGFAVALLATGFVIVIAQPIRDGLQRTVNRVMYGDRDDPYQGIARLKERIETSLTGEEMLPVVIETIATSLRLPYVAIELEDEQDPTIAVARGQAPDDPVAVPLVHQSEPVGRLLVAPRVGEERLSDTDHRLLSALATQVSAAIKTMQLDEELQRSRERLVAAREEERRRLRRELHDGIGPTLAGSLLQLQAARAALSADPQRAEDLLTKLEVETREAIAAVRRVARELRPPALDALGLVGALREQAGHFSADPELEVELIAPPEMPPLTAAHEVAVYRIVLEALTNVVRHSSAAQSTVELEAGSELVVTITDDGRGVAPGAPVGVGLRSMRERAVELGGTLQVTPLPGGGTVVRASLPLAGPTA